jgi:hypothetical protein
MGSSSCRVLISFRLSVAQMRNNPKGIRFADAVTVCNHYFGKARQKSSSRLVYETPWIGDPRVNIQNDKGDAKAYQVRQILKAIDKLEAERETKNR